MAYGFLYTLPTITGSHTDFPVVLKTADFPATSIDGSANAFTTGGGEIKAYTSSAKTTQLPIEVVTFVSSATVPEAEVWVKIGTAATGGTIYLEKDAVQTAQPAVTDTYGRNAVWSDYEAVYHGNDLVDATGNGHTLTRVGTPTEGNAGKIGGAFNLDGSTEYYDLTSNIASAEPLSLSAWFNANNITAQHTIACLGNNGAQGMMRLFAAGATTGDPVRAQKQGDTGVAYQSDTTSGYSASTWEYAVGSFASDTSRSSFLNGGSKATDTNSVADPTGDFTTIGVMKRSTTAHYFGGSLDEVRFSLRTYSDDWIAEEYANQNASTAWGTVGAWSDSGGGPTGIQIFRRRIQQRKAA